MVLANVGSCGREGDRTDDCVSPISDRRVTIPSPGAYNTVFSSSDVSFLPETDVKLSALNCVSQEPSFFLKTHRIQSFLAIGSDHFE